MSWIKFRGPILNQGSCMQNFSFVDLSSRSEPRSHKISLEPDFEATRKDPDPKKFRGPLLTSLICVSNFKVISGLEVPQLEKPNDPPKAACLIYKVFKKNPLEIFGSYPDSNFSKFISKCDESFYL